MGDRSINIKANTPKTGDRALTSNHTLVGATDEFATGFLQHILAFLGCSEINIVDATGLANDRVGILAAANDRIQTICRHAVSHNISTAAE